MNKKRSFDEVILKENLMMNLYLNEKKKLLNMKVSISEHEENSCDSDNEPLNTRKKN